MIKTNILLIATFIVILAVYYILFPPMEIVNLIFSEYIAIGITFILIGIYFYFKIILKDKELFEFLPNTNYISIKSTILFFLFFEAIDYYNEGSLIGMIKLWFMYWIFGVLAYFLTHNINFYKNYKTYKI